MKNVRSRRMARLTVLPRRILSARRKGLIQGAALTRRQPRFALPKCGWRDDRLVPSAASKRLSRGQSVSRGRKADRSLLVLRPSLCFGRALAAERLVNLHTKLLEREASGRPVTVAVIGAGKFGTMFLSQARLTQGMHVVAVADLD